MVTQVNYKIHRSIFHRPNKKIFVVGLNKTGTTSMGQALHNLGFRVGFQPDAEKLLGDWEKRRFHRIKAYCRSADVFQDVPFSLDFTYQAMDVAFPGSRFILTERDSAEEWYESLVRFNTKIVGRGRIPKANDLKEFRYRGTGWLWRAHRALFDVDETTVFEKALYIRKYEEHNARVKDYFRYRQDDLLILKLSDDEAMQKLCQFLNITQKGTEMPKLNVSGASDAPDIELAAFSKRTRASLSQIVRMGY